MTLLDTRLRRAVYRQEAEQIHRLLGAGVDVNGRDEDGYTALMHAVLADGSYLPTIYLLLDAGADVNTTDDLGCTPLHFAAQSRPDVLELLIERGAGIDPKDDHGNTPLWHAVFAFRHDEANSTRVIRTLLSHGADMHTRNHHDASPWDLVNRVAEADDIRAIFQEYATPRSGNG